VKELKTIAFLIRFAANMIAQDDSITKLFPGKWEVDVENAEVYEEWKLLNENELTGISYSVNDGVKNISENLYLKRFADKWTYIAVPKNQNPTLFAIFHMNFIKTAG
jgi:hypothetical protein